MTWWPELLEVTVLASRAMTVSEKAALVVVA